MQMLIEPGSHWYLLKERVWNMSLSAAASAVCQRNDPTTPHPTDSMFCVREADGIVTRDVRALAVVGCRHGSVTIKVQDLLT
jgi:hypothetical protein